ncbi:ATP-binding protein [Streptomyces huasconensis]|uniref:ATP-binding protein n=1 Tax=Streptomyces huasconensis TaxID=1854574 RepID=A0ABV3M180_9ACTN
MSLPTYECSVTPTTRLGGRTLRSRVRGQETLSYSPPLIEEGRMRTDHSRHSVKPLDRTVFDKRTEAVPRAREFARAFLNGLSPALDEQAAASVELTVSELITNSVRHARGESCSLRLVAHPDAVTVAVTDADPRPPRERTPDLAGGTGGFGWPMVRSLAREVHVSTGPQGKTVRADLPRG